MSYQLFAGLYTEGHTDLRFLESVVKRTLDQVAFECKGDIETELEVIEIDTTGLSFQDQILKASQEGVDKFGIMMLCVHTDADDSTDETAFENKLNPAIKALQQQKTIGFVI